MNRSTAEPFRKYEAPPLPNNPDAERSVIGAIILDNKAIDRARTLKPEDFFVEENRRIFRAITTMSEAGLPIDLLTLVDYLGLQGELDAAGGAAYIASVPDGMPKISNVSYYAGIVLEKARRRSLIHETERIQLLAFRGPDRVENLLVEGVKAFRELAITETVIGSPEERLKNLLEDARMKVGASETTSVIAALQSELRQLQPEQAFPATLAKIALQGVVGKFIDAALPCTEADENCLAYQFLAAVGNVMGRTNYSIFGSDVHYPSLYTLIVGDTSSGKGQGLSAVRLLMNLVDQDWEGRCVKYSAASGEAVVSLASQNADSGGRLCLIMPEMAVLLNSANRLGSNTSGYLRLAWDGLPLENNRSRSAEIARNYLLSLVGHITPEELTTILNHVDWYNGLANRFLWAIVRKSKTLPRMERQPNFAGLAETLKKLLALPAIGQVEFTDKAGGLFDDWVYALPVLDGQLGAYQQRLRPYALRLALIYATLDENRLALDAHRLYSIEPKHVYAAIEVVTRSRESVAWFLNRPMKIDSKAAHEDIVKFRTAMNEKGSRMTGTELSNLFSHKTAQERMDIASRAGAKLRSQESNGGKPTALWTW